MLARFHSAFSLVKSLYFVLCTLENITRLCQSWTFTIPWSSEREWSYSSSLKASFPASSVVAAGDVDDADDGGDAAAEMVC